MVAFWRFVGLFIITLTILVGVALFDTGIIPTTGVTWCTSMLAIMAFTQADITAGRQKVGKKLNA